MNRETVLEQFIANDLIPEILEKKLEMDDFMRSHQQKFVSKLCSDLKEFLAAVQKQQENGLLDPVLAIGIHILRTEVLLQDYRIMLCAYNKQFYMDEHPFQAYIDMSVFFRPFDELYIAVDEKRAGYHGKIHKSDVDSYVQELVTVFRMYLTELSRSAARQLAVESAYTTIQIAEPFFMVCGEYQESFDEVYITEKEIRSAYEIEMDLKNSDTVLGMECKVLYDYHFRDVDFSEANFCKSRFHRTEFYDVNLNGAQLIKTEFHQCHFENVSFEGAFLFDAVFKDCIFENCDFASTHGFITYPGMGLYHLIGFTGVYFHSCSFIHSLFTDANFSGAHFIDPDFKNVSFEETVLKGARISSSAVSGMGLNKDQLQTVNIL